MGCDAPLSSCVADRINVLRVIARLNVGGPALHVAYLAAGLADRGYDRPSRGHVGQQLRWNHRIFHCRNLIEQQSAGARIHLWKRGRRLKRQDSNIAEAANGNLPLQSGAIFALADQQPDQL